MTSIARLAFFQCGMRSIKIGRNITTIEDTAFYYCSNCTIFDFRRATSIPTLESSSAFTQTPSNKEIIVPDILYNDWRSANIWSYLSNNIVKASESSLGSLT